MKGDLLTILPKIIDYDNIPYSAGLDCPDCGKGNFEAYSDEYVAGNNRYFKPIAVGWCDTPWGFMGVFECPACHTRFRFHCGNHSNDIDDFEFKFYQWVFMCENFKEVRSKLDEMKNKNKV